MALAIARSKARVDCLFAEEVLDAAEQAVIADLVKAGRQDALEETADEFGAGKAYALLRLWAVGVFEAVVAIAEGDAVLVNGDQAVVGGGNADHIAPKVADQVLRLGEGFLSVDNPVVVVQAHYQSIPLGVKVDKLSGCPFVCVLSASFCLRRSGCPFVCPFVWTS
jgi:hypothetical protein